MRPKGISVFYLVDTSELIFRIENHQGDEIHLSKDHKV
jgi:hypothetical protein